MGTDPPGQRRMLENLGFTQLDQAVHNDWAWRKEETVGGIKPQSSQLRMYILVRDSYLMLRGKLMYFFGLLCTI